MPVSAEPEFSELLCPACGFDLRGTPGDRCGECGLVVDRASLHTSGFPWAHRTDIGHVRAYVRTVWQVGFRSSKLSREMARSQDVRDARAFARVTASLLGLALAIPFALLAFNDRSLESLNLHKVFFRGGAFMRPTPEPAMDFTLPWSAGAMLWPTIPVCLLLFAAYLTGLPRSVLVKKHFESERRARATAISYYVTAPLALLAPAALMLIPLFADSRGSLQSDSAGQQILLLAVIGELVAFSALILFVVRVGQWARRISHSGVLGAMLAIGQLLALMIFGVLMLFGLLPWSVGFVRIVLAGLG